MSKFKIKSLGLLTALSLLPSPKAAAEDAWGVGVKVGLSSSYAKPAEETAGVKTHYFNPWFGGSIYSEYAFNDYIGIGAELLYNRFTASFSEGKFNVSRVIDTFGGALTFGLYWTSFIRPDFKEDCFLARLFFGVYPFYCCQDKSITKEDSQEKFCVDVIDEVNQAAKKANDDKYKYKRYIFSFIVGHGFEFPNGLLLELKGILPYNLYQEKDAGKRLDVSSFHISLGYNFAKLAEN